MTTMRLIGLLSTAATLAAPLAAQTSTPEIVACYDAKTNSAGKPQGSGIVYRIQVPGVVNQQACVDADDVQFSWTIRHGALTGLNADDHSQYLLADGVRATTNGFAVTGTLGTGTIPVEGAGVRLMWYPGKAAFRAGTVGGIHWNDEKIGLYSTAMGVGTIASGEGATALGFQTQATGEGSTALGHSTTASGFGSTALGVTNVTSGFGSTAMGSSNVASGSFSTAMGRLASTNLKTGSFVYGDAAGTSLVNATADNSFVVRAQNVWFGKSGDQPTSPAGYFTVDGVIASTVGGFKFPDGTVQTTAASGGASGTPENVPGTLVQRDPTTGGFAAGPVTLNGGFLATGGGAIPATGAGTRLMWHPGKSALRAGLVDGVQWDDANVGEASTAVGRNTTASAIASTALGWGTVASAAISTAMGFGTTASGDHSTAMGNNTTASGLASTATGLQTTAGGNFSTAMGVTTKASGDQSVAMGGFTTASGGASTAMGTSTTASGTSSTAMGISTSASGAGATAIGVLTTATGEASTAMGAGSDATGRRSTAMGTETNASGETSTAMGDHTAASGEASTAMGSGTAATGQYSTAMGRGTLATGDHSTAMGSFASTNSQRGAFVYGDASTTLTETFVTATAANQFVVRAAGGTIFYSSSDLSAGVSLAAGGGSFASVSDVNRKEHFREVDGEDVLGKIARMPIQEWNYKSQGASIRHLGPTAQDFRTAFGLGESDTTITTTDIDGVNLLAVQALERRTREQAKEIEALRTELAALRAEVARRKQ